MQDSEDRGGDSILHGASSHQVVRAAPVVRVSSF